MSEPVRLGKYTLLRLLGSGGMGEVYLARQEGPAGFVKSLVVKRILRRLAEDQTFVDLFLGEARLAAQLSHPNVVQIFELGEEGGAYFMAMEHVHGHSLRAVQRQAAKAQGPLEPSLVARICSQALQGLHYAHGRGIVHRDVSPENILVSFDGAVKVVDFGLAPVSPGLRAGKLAYMAPELLTGGTATPRSDLYSMGVVLHELLTGELPFAEESEAELAKAILEAATPGPRDREPELPPRLDQLVRRAICREASERFASADQMATELEELLASRGEVVTTGQLAQTMRSLFGEEAEAKLDPGEPTAPHTQRLSPEAPPPRRRLRRLALIMGLFLVPVVAWEIYPQRPPARLPEPAPQPAAPPTSEAERDPLPAEEKPPAVEPARPRQPDRRPGRVKVLVNPWAEVLYLGRSLGVTPMKPISLPPGRQKLTLRNPELGVEVQRQVEVRPGVETVLRADLLDELARRSRSANPVTPPRP